MPENIRVLVVLLVLGSAVWWLARPLAAEQLRGAHALRRGVWFALTAAALGLGDFWAFTAVAIVILWWARGREENAPAMFLALLFVVPSSEVYIPGFGIINYLFALNFPRLLALVLLLPLVPRLMRQPRPPGGLARFADFLFAGYFGLQVLLLAREPSFTASARGAFYLFVDLFLPYFVFSRALQDMARVRDAVTSLVIAGMVLALVGVFETTRSWLLFESLVNGWGSPEPLLYLERSGRLRAMGTAGHAIALGYLMGVCLLLALPLLTRVQPRWRQAALLLLLLGGWFSALSRGPWIGTAAGLAVYILLGPSPIKRLLLLGGGGVAALGVISLLPFGGFVVGLIPFIGNVETGNIDYRQKLLENAQKLIWENPLLGSTDYTERLAAMGMVQGQGIVDIVNSYVQVALDTGLVGLTLFGGLLATALLCAVLARRQAHQADLEEEERFGRALAAAQVAVLVTILSVSSIVVIPWVYWCLAGLLVGYARVVQATVVARREARRVSRRSSEPAASAALARPARRSRGPSYNDR